MQLLDLMNSVLRRLRENDINSTQVDSTPFYRMIKACVNDAKYHVENSWHWSQLRDTDTFTLDEGVNTVLLPNSVDNGYTVEGIYLTEGPTTLQQIDTQRMARYLAEGPGSGTPTYYCPAPGNADGSLQIYVYPAPSNDTTEINVARWKRQDELTNYDDNLSVPSVAVYTYAWALAARERGETGSMTSGEIYVIAESQLADAIALDAGRNPTWTDWYYSGVDRETNVRGF